MEINKPENSYDFEIGDELSDMKLIIEDKTLYVHKAILATVSPVFKKMFTLNFKENLENEVKLPDKKCNDIVELLKLIYPNFTHELENHENLMSLLELSEEYNINIVKTKIENHLIKKIHDSKYSSKNKLKKFYGKSIEDELSYHVDLLSISLAYQLAKLRIEVIDFISSMFEKSQLEANVKFTQNVDDKIKLEIYAKKIEYLEERLKIKEANFKKLQDDFMRHKFQT